MANVAAFNVYQINNNALPNVTNTAFHGSNIKAQAITPLTTPFLVNGSRMYSIITELPRGLNQPSVNNYVVETVAAIATALA